MLSYKNFKKYMNGNQIDYLKYLVKYLFYGIVHTVYSCYICLRFPFLYPRNRFTNRHYTNKKILDKRSDIYWKWDDYSKNHMNEYFNKFGWDAFFIKPDDSDTDLDISSDDFDGNFIINEYIMKLATKKDRFMYWLYGFYHQILEIIHCIPFYNELDAMDNGWKKNFGIDFCKDLKKAILKDGGWKYMITKFRIMQIKEKYGVLVVYPNYYTENVQNVLNSYEELSQHVCINCGKEATKRTLSYICPYCDGCYEKGNYGVFKYIKPKTEDEFNHNKEVDEMLDKC